MFKCCYKNEELNPSMFLWQIVLESFAYISWRGHGAVGAFPVGESPAIGPSMPILPARVCSINLGHFGGFGTLLCPTPLWNGLPDCSTSLDNDSLHSSSNLNSAFGQSSLYTKVMSMLWPKVRRCLWFNLWTGRKMEGSNREGCLPQQNKALVT